MSKVKFLLKLKGKGLCIAVKLMKDLDWKKLIKWSQIFWIWILRVAKTHSFKKKIRDAIAISTSSAIDDSTGDLSRDTSSSVTHEKTDLTEIVRIEELSSLVYREFMKKYKNVDPEDKRYMDIIRGYLLAGMKETNSNLWTNYEPSYRKFLQDKKWWIKKLKG